MINLLNVFLFKQSDKLKKKLYRLLTSKNFLKLVSYYHKFFGEKFRKELPLPKIFDHKVSRLNLINKIIQDYNLNNYLEIGCDQDEVFSSINLYNKVGVDPVRGGNLRLKSDDFFKQNKDFFDLIFIDGLHEYSQVKRDVLNSINILNPKGIILVHDCMPLTYLDQAIPRGQRKWNGDVWKIIVEFRTREDIFTCVGCFDQGIGMILKKKNNKILNIDNSLTGNFKSLSYESYYKNFTDYLNLINYEDFLNIIDKHRLS